MKMSWFDAAGLASIAKSALKEAQRTIDKALDIKEDPNIVPANTPIDANTEDFFGTWGITQSGNINDVKPADDKQEKPEDIGRVNRGSISIWGSFTGSFFDASKEHVKSISIDSLDDSADIVNEQFSRSKLVVQQSEDGESHSGKIGGTECDEGSDTTLQDVPLSGGIDSRLDVESYPIQSPPVAVNPIKKRDKPMAPYANRLSIISNESGKNSSESVELITGSTECTTTPESDILSYGHSLSTSSSALGSKPASDSVEVLPDSLTSPSSVEVLGSDGSSRRHSQYTDEFVSPMESPGQEDSASSAQEKSSPDSVEVIPEEQEDNSVAEDTMSYTSVSESTSATVLENAFNLHLKPQKIIKETFTKPENLTEDVTLDIPPSPEKSIHFGDAITKAPSRAMHLPLAQINHTLIDTQPQSSMQDITNILKNTNVIDIPQETNEIKNSSFDNLLEVSTDDGSQSDKTVVYENVMESSSDTSTAESSHSTYLKTMLAEAMSEKVEANVSTEKSEHFMNLTQSMIDSTQANNVLSDISITQLDMPPRETSPLSSESLVKIGSDHTSGHTSGDELETTTSSDIEIISSPNGDSSSTQSRQSPAKQTSIKHKHEDSQVDALLCKMTLKKAKGHTRELSGASSVSDDSHSSEVDRLMKTISEISEILESREAKLIEVNRKNAELQEVNSDLRQQLDLVLTKQLETSDLSQVTEEYTQRLSALEKKFQQAIREKDTLRKQLDHCKQESATRMGKAELEALISDKDETIKELREEGEKLSKQQLNLSNIIKKLRTKEKENETSIKHLKENIEDLSSETERLKRSLTAKEEVERSQIEAVHQLTSKNKKLESEVGKLQSELDDLSAKYETVKKSLDAAKKELLDKNRASSELHVREQLLENLESEKKMTEAQNEEILRQLDDLRLKLRCSEQEYIKKEKALRNENHELLRRAEEVEARNEELSQSVIEVSKPLVRQLEALQATHNMKVSGFEKLEHEMTMKINELQNKLQSLISNERVAKDECVSLRSKLADVEGKLGTLRHQLEMTQMNLEQQKAEKQIVEQEMRRVTEELKEQLKQKSEKLDELTNEVMTLQQQLSIERATVDMERKRSVNLQNHLPDPNDGEQSAHHTGSNSPTLSMGKASISESMNSSVWTLDEPFEMTQTPRYTNVFEMQMLQTNLKQREGEVQQLQWELNRREQERSLLNTEISTLLTRVEDLEVKVKDCDTMKTQFEEVQQQYDTLCQLYGEKVEENEELKLDLEDVKDMYKGQIDELLKQQKQNS